MTLENALATYVEKIVDSYRNRTTYANVSQEFLDGMQDKFEKSVEVTPGKKYIRVSTDGSVHSYIVNTETDPKFQYGDILKPAGRTPARNQARGNIFGNYQIHWTGPNYLR